MKISLSLPFQYVEQNNDHCWLIGKLKIKCQCDYCGNNVCMAKHIHPKSFQNSSLAIS